MRKFDTLHKIRLRTDNLETVSSLLKQEISNVKQEEDNMKEYKAELDLLLAEKLHHVEILRQIHSDISMIENVMKQGRQALLAGESRTVSLHKEYTPLRKELNDLRKEVNLDAVAESEIDDLDLSSIKSHNRRSSGLVNGERSKSKSGSKRPLSSGGVDKKGAEHSSTLPPMKQCASCHQHIHRNAPICPLCKAKSRSRNPKKAKK